MGEWIEGSWEWKFEWERTLRERDLEQLRALRSCVCKIRLNAGTMDAWRWKAAGSGVFSVKTAYETFFKNRRWSNVCGVQKELAMIWKAQVPAKVIATAWKVLKGRIATMDNHRRRQVVTHSAADLCPLCQLKEETIEHLLFLCHKTDEIWKEILRWTGKQAVFHFKSKAHFNAFVNLGSKKDVDFFLGVWLCVIWSIWKIRNNCIFNQGSWNKERVMAEIKARLWVWRSDLNQPTQEHKFRRWFFAVRGFDC
ncbi:uncharacterized protein LOC131018490 [Salvia miltiorrhiza]|uniref:uncharacterized protein LOC131018490 n=1 Tax=Salvia miltiorrhiza TaxID=226208 RepID=UPI0025ACE3B9|nr:uncharacterized protein LOC131018490 [Salvia miltiorrhiza]